MNANKPLTVVEALKQIRTDLGKVPVKVEDIRAIGNPILSAVLNLDLVISALENAEVKQEAENGENVDDKREDV